MKKGTVRRRIFVSNTAMILATLFLFLMVNLLVVKIYSETIEKAFLDSAEQIVNGQELEELLKQRILYQNKFLLLIAADGIICVLILVGVSRFFTRNLKIHIMEPLDALTEGAKRVQNNDLQQEIVYTGDEEFEQVCDVFNEMQHHLCEEQEKNHRYEKARTDMIAGISHDLRTSLTAIRGSIKGLLDGVASSPEMREKFLQTAYRRTGEMEVLIMIKEGFHGFCMALADSVPGVSGGTVAFLMGFYDSFIGSIDALVFGSRKKKRTAFTYLVKLGVGWFIGMAMAVLVLSSLFERKIYTVSSVFVGLIAGSIPLIWREERESFREKKGIPFLIIGIALVFFGFGILAGAATVVKGIRICLGKYRPQAVYGILGMMIGSFYAIIQGPTTLQVPQAAMTLGTFQIPAAILGLVLVLGMQIIKERSESYEH